MNERVVLPVFALSFLLILFPPTVHSQQDEACSNLVQDAYDLTQTVCEGIGDDEACYGNLTVNVAPDDLPFSQPGDLTGVDEIESLRLSSMNSDDAEWGISLIHVQALASEDDAPQTVELVLFGNVEIENAADEDSGFAPLQAFTFQSEVGDRPCEEAPDSGLMIQTPAGVGEITLLVNEVTIDLGSTAFLQAGPNNEMIVNIVEGQADVSAQGTTISVPAGARARIPLDADGLADGPPQGPEPYDENSLQTLPVPLLTEQVAIAPALEDDASSGSGDAEGSAQSDQLAPIEGTWSTADCDGNTSVQVVAVNGDEITMTENGFVATFALIEPGSYLYVDGGGVDYSEAGLIMNFQSITESNMESVMSAEGFECSWVFTR